MKEFDLHLNEEQLEGLRDEYGRRVYLCKKCNELFYENPNSELYRKRYIEETQRMNEFENLMFIMGVPEELYK